MEFKSNKTITKVVFEGIDMKLPRLTLGTKVISKDGIYKATDEGLEGYSSIEVCTEKPVEPLQISIPFEYDLSTASTKPHILYGLYTFKISNLVFYSYSSASGTSHFNGLFCYNLLTQQTTKIADGHGYSLYQQVDQYYIIVGGTQNSKLLLINTSNLNVTILDNNGYKSICIPVDDIGYIISSNGISGTGQGTWFFNKTTFEITKIINDGEAKILCRKDYTFIIRTKSSTYIYDLNQNNAIPIDNLNFHSSYQDFTFMYKDKLVLINSTYASTSSTSKALQIFDLTTKELFIPDIPMGYGYWGHSTPHIELKNGDLYLLGSSKNTHTGMYIVNLDSYEVTFINSSLYYFKCIHLNENITLLTTPYTGSSYSKTFILLDNNTKNTKEYTLDCFISSAILTEPNKALLIPAYTPFCLYELNLETKEVGPQLYYHKNISGTDCFYKIFPEQRKILFITKSSYSTFIEYNIDSQETVLLVKEQQTVNITSIEYLNQIGDKHLIKINNKIIYAYTPTLGLLEPFMFHYEEAL